LDHVSPATRLLERRRQMFEMQEALETQKEEFARHEETFKRREEALRKKDLELQESLIKFNKFLQENESKRNRAVKRAADERKQREQKEQELQKLQKQYSERCAEEERLKEDLTGHKCYQDYLGSVVEAVPEDYPEVQDLLNRFKTLKDANRDLSRGQGLDEAENERLRNEYASYTKECANEILNENNEIAAMQKRLEVSGRDVFILQNELDNKIRSMSDRTLEMGQVLGSVANILDRCERGSRIKRAGLCVTAVEKGGAKTIEDLAAEGKLAMERLEEICNYMIDYGGIVVDYLETQKKQRK
ncbi:unnamed protein product, partial [Chrysoparadoxa australica]